MKGALLAAVVAAAILATPGGDGALAQERTATRADILVLTEQIDALDGFFRTKLLNVEEEVAELERRLNAADGQLLAIGQFEASVEQAQRLSTTLAEALTKLEAASAENARLAAEVAQAVKSAEAAEKRADSIQWIVSGVSAVVSVLVILVSLFFSHRFTTLYADTKVSQALLARLEKGVAEKADGPGPAKGEAAPAAT